MSQKVFVADWEGLTRKCDPARLHVHLAEEALMRGSILRGPQDLLIRAFDRRSGRRGAPVYVAVSALMLLLWWAVRPTERRAQQDATRFLVPLPEKASFRDNDRVVLSPDGTSIAFTAANAAGSALYLRSLNAIGSLQTLCERALSPFWSPDSRYVAYFADGKLRKTDIKSGLSSTICNTEQGLDGAWNQDGVIIFASSAPAGLARVSSNGGAAVPVTKVDSLRGEIAHLWPSFLPDGKHFLFTIRSQRRDVQGVYIGVLSSPEVARILPEEANAQYEDGFLFFTRAGILVAQRFDTGHLKLIGRPVLSVGPVVRYGGGSGARYSVGRRTIAFHSGAITSTRMVWYDRSGTPIGYLGEPGMYSNPSISPDGQTVAVCLRDASSKTRDIWLFRIANGTGMRLVSDPADDFNPVWSPDSQRIAFTSDRGQQRDLYVKSARASGVEHLLFGSPQTKNAEDWTLDGRFLIFNGGISDGNRNVYALPLFGVRQAFPVVTGPFILDQGHVSPDCKWIAYRSQELGEYQVNVEGFPRSAGKWRISNAGGADPQWNRNGRELFYVEKDDKLMVVQVKASRWRFETEAPKPLFEVPFIEVGRNRYVVSPDGQRFLAIVRDTGPPQITVVLNWQGEMRR